MKSGAIFDMDGLMFDSERLYQETWREIADREGVVLGPHFTQDICGTSGDLLRSVVKKYYHTDNPDSLFQECSSKVAEKMKDEVPMKPGLLELLELFTASGVKLAVASSSKAELIEQNLSRSDTRHYFDKVVSGTFVEHGKPAPDIFLLAAKEIGCDPKDCYVFEDSINGVMAGLAAGCETIMVPDYIGPTETVRNSEAHICSSLSEAAQRIGSGEF
ncbi:MAG: HAD family phosphatase [Solobacterium sp.]|nr:HAD family phosphatase [Solobacterium sp.]